MYYNFTSEMMYFMFILLFIHFTHIHCLDLKVIVFFLKKQMSERVHVSKETPTGCMTSVERCRVARAVDTGQNGY